MGYNPLDDIYARYKRGDKGQSFNGHKINRRNEDESDSDFGVTEPVIDSQFESDLSGVRVCPKCGSLNISFDMSSNRTICNDCKENTNKPNRIDFQKKMEQAREEEQKRIEEALRRGDTFL